MKAFPSHYRHICRRACTWKENRFLPNSEKQNLLPGREESLLSDLPFFNRSTNCLEFVSDKAKWRQAGGPEPALTSFYHKRLRYSAAVVGGEVEGVGRQFDERCWIDLVARQISLDGDCRLNHLVGCRRIRQAADTMQNYSTCIITLAHMSE